MDKYRTGGGRRRKVPELVDIGKFSSPLQQKTNNLHTSATRGTAGNKKRRQIAKSANDNKHPLFTADAALNGAMSQDMQKYQERSLPNDQHFGGGITLKKSRAHGKRRKQKHLPPLHSTSAAEYMPSVSISKDSKYVNPLTSMKAPKLHSNSGHGKPRRVASYKRTPQQAGIPFMGQYGNIIPPTHQHYRAQTTDKAFLPGMSFVPRPGTRSHNSSYSTCYHHRHSNRITNEIYKRNQLGSSTNGATPNGLSRSTTQQQVQPHQRNSNSFHQTNTTTSDAHVRRRQSQHILCKFPIVTRLLQFLTGIQEWSNDLIFHKDLATYLSISHDWYHCICAYMIELRMQRMNRLMEKIGINFAEFLMVYIWLGSNHPESSAYYNIPSQFVKLNEYYISKRVLRHSDWEMIVNMLREENSDPADLNTSLSSWNNSKRNYDNVVSSELLQQSQLNTIILPDCHAHIQRDTEETHPDPLLILPFQNCAKIADALGASLPTWQQWEVAARGKDSFPFPWGYQPVSARNTGVEHVKYSYIGCDSNLRQKWKSGHVTRIKSLRHYHRRKSPFGVEDLVLFAKEFNLAQDDLAVRSQAGVSSHQMFQECQVDTHLLRSLCYLGPQTTFVPSPSESSQNPVDIEGFDKMASSEHRSFNGPTLSACEPHMGCTPNDAPQGGDTEAAVPTVGGGRYHQQKGVFRLVFSMSSWFQVHPLFSTGLHECLRCGTRQRHSPLCMKCLRGDDHTHPLWFSLLGELWHNVPQIVGIQADLEKKVPDWTRHRFHFLYFEGILLSSTLAKNEPKTIDDLMRVEEITFCGPQYTVELNGYTFEHGYMRQVLEGLYFGMSGEEIVRVFGEGYNLEDGAMIEYSGTEAILHDRVTILYLDDSHKLERVSVRMKSQIDGGRGGRSEAYMYEDIMDNNSGV
eukprot:CAMPEP_0117437280 /NCGR_PEP_ID=MMETSP0759-20121206/1442_1 /TAXON_ID=63605 /ORGANISM="Percolomonas cosmopolitus, Strain WS" /LENGTH=912 /DNA_ID=CAMNT_0005228907 /DNA_START=51 /DNA_END=2786 /DNA_ORIENTATION=+